jgi:hypothetical protein
MTQIRITTNRLPQPERHKGAVLEVSPEKAAAMVAQGFAEILSDAPAADAAPVRRRRVAEPNA